MRSLLVHPHLLLNRGQSPDAFVEQTSILNLPGLRRLILVVTFVRDQDRAVILALCSVILDPALPAK